MSLKTNTVSNIHQQSSLCSFASHLITKGMTIKESCRIPPSFKHVIDFPNIAPKSNVDLLPS